VSAPVIKPLGGGFFSFRCPGCGNEHVIPTGEGAGARWGFNGSLDKPTFTPSILARSGHHIAGYDGGDCWCKPDAEGTDRGFSCYLCHSFVIDGRIEFLSDCSHALVGQTVDMPPIAKAEA
jgi:hypothetical protein